MYRVTELTDFVLTNNNAPDIYEMTYRIDLQKHYADHLGIQSKVMK